MKTQDAYEAIKSIIVRTDPRDAYAFSETYFSETLNMSRTPVRAALQRLQYEDLITIIPHQGIVVREISYEEARQLFDFRALVEGYLIRKSIDKLGEEDFDEMMRMIQKMDIAARDKDYDSFLELDEQFHLYMYRYYDNPPMKDVVRRYKARMYRVRYKCVMMPGRIESSVVQHRRMVELLREGKTEETIHVLEEHQTQLERFLTNMD